MIVHCPQYLDKPASHLGIKIPSCWGGYVGNSSKRKQDIVGVKFEDVHLASER